MSDETMHDDMMSDGGSGTLPASCAAFDESLADYLDGTLGADARSDAEAHLAACARCSALVADLAEISAAARALPAIVPSAQTTEAMWRGVSERIATPAVSIGAARSVRRDGFEGWRRQLAAAAALVLVTAGVTYSLAHDAGRDDRGRVPVSTPVAIAPTPAPLGSVGPQTPLRSSEPENVASSAPVRPAPTPGAGETRVVKGGGRGTLSRPSATATYEREIRDLGSIIDQRRGDLDSATVAVLERNLAVIDDAIRQSRAALARDPRSRFLDQQLNSALDKKVELLRTAALLPSRT